jgi:hypothetical protein
MTRFEKQHDKSKNYDILFQAQRDWESLHTFRERFNRCSNYADGKQLNDSINDPDKPGQTISEADYIRRQGKVPLVQNKIFSIERNIVGQYRSNADKSMVLVRDPEKTNEESILSDILQAVAAANQLTELDAQNLVLLLRSGAMMQRLSFQYLKEYDRSDIYIENINPNRIFFNADVKDLRMNDLCRIGVIHDISLDQLLAKFAKNKEEERFLKQTFKAHTVTTDAHNGLTGKDETDIDFISSYNRTRMRIYECWNLESVWKTYFYDPANGEEGITDLPVAKLNKINERRTQQALSNGVAPQLIEYRQQLEPIWYFRFLLPDGTALMEGETPYRHQSHPFEIRLFPFINGNTYGLEYPLIDQQRILNRIFTLWDFAIGAGAKGVLLIPEECIPDGMTLKEFADEWVRFNGVIAYKASKNPNAKLPTQITTNSVPAGMFEMMNITMKAIEDISGVHAAIQGKTPNSGTSGTLYQQETQNATINTLDLMKTISSFKERRDRKILKLAMQFYNGKRRIISTAATGGVITIDPENIRNLDFDIQVVQNTDTPTYRNLAEQRMMELVMKGILDPMTYFQNSSDPISKKIYESLKQTQEQQQQQQQLNSQQLNN